MPRKPSKLDPNRNVTDQVTCIMATDQHDRQWPVLVDAADMPLINQYKWRINAKQRATGETLVPVASSGRTTVVLGRLLLQAETKDIVRYENGSSLDCRRVNLEVCTKGNSNSEKAQLRRVKDGACSVRGTALARFVAELRKEHGLSPRGRLPKWAQDLVNQRRR